MSAPLLRLAETELVSTLVHMTALAAQLQSALPTITKLFANVHQASLVTHTAFV